MHTNHTQNRPGSLHSAKATATRTIIEQGRRWFCFAQALDAALRTEGSRLWVKPKLHAQYGLRQTQVLRARSFVLTTRLDSGGEHALLSLLEEGFRTSDELHVRRTKRGTLALSTQAGHELGTLNRPAGSWVCPLVEAGYAPKFYLREVAVHDGALKAHVVIAHFHEGVEAYLMEHYRQKVEAVLA